MSVADTIGECIEGTEFHYFDSVTDFTGAELVCESLNGELVSVEDQAKYDKVTEFYDTTIGPPGARFWIGLEGSRNNPANFFWSNGITDQTFYERAGRFPWRSSRPNGNHAVSCVTIRTTDKEFQDLACSSTDVNFMCEVPCSIGTDSPTESPSKFPTKFPTDKPTTKAPTETGETPAPTKFPTTVVPTKFPTAGSGVPTKFPTTGVPTIQGEPQNIPEAVSPDSFLNIGLEKEGEIAILSIIACLACCCGFFIIAYFKGKSEEPNDDEEKLKQELTVASKGL